MFLLILNFLSIKLNAIQPTNFINSIPKIMNFNNILENPIKNWDNPSFEIYRYKLVPEIIIIDTIDYSMQSDLFKRLAFFVEKKGYVGKIYSMDELGNKRGWNAHDYNAKNLSQFFNRANSDNIPLTDGEQILKTILLNTKVINITEDEFTPGVGAIISISRSSTANFRSLILRHEIIHGLYFTSGDLRNYVDTTWDDLEKNSKKIITMFLDSLTYDVTNKDLLKNEFLAYLLQRDENETYKYFNSTVYNRLILHYPKEQPMIDEYFKRNKTPFSYPLKKLNNYIKKNTSGSIF